ncbi:MAG TPA: IS481 family transposase [Polyangium sp.]|nr:IS481 family transposase [Polyangium sp.]
MRMRWARLRFQIIGSLFAAPPEPAHLSEAIEALANTQWRHPTTGEHVQFGASTIERWYYQAKRAPVDTMEALARKVREDAGTQTSMHAALREASRGLYRDFPAFSYQLHADNLRAMADSNPTLAPVPSYSTIRRYLMSHGMLRERPAKKPSRWETYQPRETRSFEVPHVNGLWHLDFHEGSLSVLLPSGSWQKPKLFGCLDDKSRLGCNAQWYLDESAETLAHGLCQAFLKRGLPRALYDDNGGAMNAAETREGMARLGIAYLQTLPYSPQMNGKQEVFWSNVESRLMPMLKGVKPLTLELLNQATQAWIEQEYNRSEHSETKQTPLQRYLDGPDVGRPRPEYENVKRAFRRPTTRMQRQSDGTITVKGIRFEIPARYRPLKRVHIRYAKWDLSSVDLCDERTGKTLCTLLPLDKAKNADMRRHFLPRETMAAEKNAEPPGMAPLLRKLMADYAATCVPPAYLPHETENDSTEETA